MRYPVEIELVGNSKLTLSALLPLLRAKINLEIKPQFITDVVPSRIEGYKAFYKQRIEGIELN